ETLYFWSFRIWKSEDRGDSWQTISADLTRSQDRLQKPLMGRRWSFDSNWDLSAMSKYNTITSLSESPVVEGLLYVGTDDGLIHVSEDGGTNWRSAESLPGVPSSYFVNDIKADLHDPDTVYVVVDDHKSGDFSPYVLKSGNRGRSWRSIASNLPDRHVLWRIVQDHVNPDLLFLGTEFGVFFTVNSGGRWTKLSGGVPNIAFRDLVIQQRESDLVGATFGRSFYVLDDYSPLRYVDEAMLQSGSVLFPVRHTYWYVPRRPHSCATPGCVDSQGDAYYVAPNPPFGAVFTYYLAEERRSLADQRRQEEKDATGDNADVDFPSWDRIGEEERENAPAIVFTVTDSSGNIIRHIEAKATAGFQRVSWDLRYPVVDPWVPESERGGGFGRPAGVLVAPGTYRVTMHERIDGELNDLDQQQTFEVVSIREPTLPGSSQQERVAFSQQVNEMRRAVNGTLSAIDEIQTELAAIRESLGNSTASLDLYTQANRISQRLSMTRDRLAGNRTQGSFSVDQTTPVTARLSHASYNPNTTAYGPTDTQRSSLSIAREVYADISRNLTELIDVEYEALKDAVEAAGVPWTPGRGILTPN
ncbi:MAG: glycosyl hydrolase, partial [Pseudomonadota bacterium]|nr:glycosyl hydrolase [Pseudomonadota bacterium]